MPAIPDAEEAGCGGPEIDHDQKERRQRINTEVPLWMATDRLFQSVTSKRLKNHHNNPRWPASHWADLWMES